MSQQSWVCVSLHTEERDRESIVELLWELQTIGFQERNCGSRTQIEAFFLHQAPLAKFEDRLRTLLKRRRLSHIEPTIRLILDDPDRWLDKFRESFRPLQVGSTFCIYPPWERPLEEIPVKLMIEPGLAFGTGTHESTRLCLQALIELAPSSRSMLDVGTGSGILALAAQKLVPRLKVWALDIDPVAVRVAKQTFLRNRIEGIGLVIGDIDSLAGSIDLVVANLALPDFERVGQHLMALAGFHLLISGITKEQEGRAREMFQGQGSLLPAGRWQENEWLCLHFTRRRDIRLDRGNFSKSSGKKWGKGCCSEPGGFGVRKRKLPLCSQPEGIDFCILDTVAQSGSYRFAGLGRSGHFRFRTPSSLLLPGLFEKLRTRLQIVKENTWSEYWHRASTGIGPTSPGRRSIIWSGFGGQGRATDLKP